MSYFSGNRKNNFIIFGSPSIGLAEIQEVVKTLKSCWIGTGPRVELFENKFKKYKDCKYAAAVSSCTAALQLSVQAAGIGRGDEVITTPLTFCATVNAIIHAGAMPVLADVDWKTMNIDPARIEEKVTKNTRAIIPVHFAGRACDMNEIMAIARRHNLKIIEDCAHAIETRYKGKESGTIGDFGCFSFYVTKNITTGEGGMVLAKRQKDIDRIKILALHGLNRDAWRRFSDRGYKHYQVIGVGFKYNMTDLQAAIGIQQLKKIEIYWKRRKTIWERYTKAFSDLPIELSEEPEPDTRHAFHLWTILIDSSRVGISRDRFIAAMTDNNVGVGVHYQSIPEHPYYQKTFGWKPQDYPNAMRIGRQTVSLPISAKLTDDDIDAVIKTVKKVLE